MLNRLSQMVRRDLELVEGIDEAYRAKVIAQVLTCDALDRDLNEIEDTPYTTFVHRDLWINNFMLLKGMRLVLDSAQKAIT